MDAEARHASLAIDRVDLALARWTLDRQAEADPTLAERYGGLEPWIDETRQRIRLLAQAVAMACPAIFAAGIRWSASAFVARDVPATDVAANLAALRATIDAHLPAALAARCATALDAAETALHEPPAAPPSHVGSERPEGRLVLRYLEAALDGRRGEAESIVLDAARGGLPVAVLHRDVLAPAQREIGRMWHLGEITVADEHLATAITESACARLRELLPAESPDAPLALVATPAGETHGLGARMVADAFSFGGWRALGLGADVPADALLACTLERRPAVVALSIASPLHLRAIAETIAALRDGAGTEAPPVIVGGGPFELDPDLWRATGAAGGATSPVDAVALADSLRRR